MSGVALSVSEPSLMLYGVRRRGTRGSADEENLEREKLGVRDDDVVVGGDGL